MFNWFNNLKIRNKLIWAFLVVISLSMMISVIALLNQNYTQIAITEFLDVDGQIAKLSRKSQSAILMVQRSEKDYFLYYKQLGFEEARTKYINQVQTDIASIHQDMAEIRELEAEEVHIAATKAIDQVVTEYETAFLAVVTLLEKRGFKNSGLEGQLRQSVHTIEAALNAQNISQLTIDILTMRRHEKDYLLRTEEQYVHRLHEMVNQFNRNITNTDLNFTEKEQLTTLANQYQAKFDQLVQIDTEIAVSIESYRAKIHHLESLLTQINTTAQLHEDRTYASIQSTVQTTRWVIISASLIVVVAGLSIAVFLAGVISKPLTFIVQGAQLLKTGDTALTDIKQAEISKIITRQDEMGDIGRIFNDLARYFKAVIEDIVQVSQGLAVGKLNITPLSEYRGDFVQIKEALEIALSNLQQVVEDIVQVSQGLAEGKQNITHQAEYLGDFVQIKNALETAAITLANTSAQNARQNWLKTGQAQLNELMSGEQHIITLANKVINFLTTYVEAQVGLFYSRKEAESDNQKASLQMIASYAYVTNDNRPQEFLEGEGLIGQVAVERKTLAFTQTVEECPPVIRSGLANALPCYVLLLPCLYENAVKSIIEIGSTKELTDIQREFLEQAMPNIGITINTAESRSRMQALLEQSQRQSEELQSQQNELQQVNDALQKQREELQLKQEELQQRNGELQTQAEELQSQSEELQTQQEELKQTNEALEERTQDLEQQKTEVQHKNLALEKNQVEMEKARAAIETKAQELELASRYKSEFLANMSHELRTPLNSLLILAQLLTENKPGNLNDKQIEYARTIHSAGADLLTLINEILDLSKVEAGKMETHLENVSLSDVVEMVEQKFRHVAAEKGLGFQTQVTNDVPAIIKTDVQRLKQIINNLLSNAFKFTSEGEIRLIIQRLVDFADNAPLWQKGTAEYITISITDTGIGIPQDKQQVIFEAFQQVDGSTSRRYGGTGLGLSISRQLARLLGGELQLQSEEGKGSTFTLYLPETAPSTAADGNISSQASIYQATGIELPGNSPPAKPSAPQSAASISPVTSEPSSSIPITDDRNNLQVEDKSLLIIEDDRKFSKILMELAGEKGFKCLIAEDGKTGLQFVEQYQPNAIILDISLPQIDGWTVMEILKDNPDTRHIPVHFISASDHTSLEAKKRGAIGYLHKPVNMEQLSTAFKQIEQFLSNNVKNLLVAVDNAPHQQNIIGLVENKDTQITLAITKAEVLQHLQTAKFDCIILDVDIEQKSGIQLLEQIYQQESLRQIPVIVYADRDLTLSEEGLLQQHANNLPIKSVRSPERLLDETTLFLHQIESHLPSTQRKMLQMVHDKEAILAQKKVLIVDDDARNTFALATILEEKNMEVFAANNGNEALELLDEHPDIAVVLMDIMMPEMDGYEATQKIRTQQRFRKLPVIALTAKAMKGDKAKCIQAGANDYLSKPVDTDKLVSLMRVWLYR